MTASKVIRAILGVGVLIALVVVVNNYWNDYQRQQGERHSTDATATVGSKSATATASANAGATVIVLTDGLNFRNKPDATGTAVRGLKKGEQLVIVTENSTWLQLKDQAGVVGWVNNNPQYLKIEKKK